MSHFLSISQNGKMFLHLLFFLYFLIRIVCYSCKRYQSESYRQSEYVNTCFQEFNMCGEHDTFILKLPENHTGKYSDCVAGT
jgi:hypothetical protein